MKANCWYGKHDVRVEEVPVDGRHSGFARRRHGRQVDHLHTRDAVDNLVGGEAGPVAEDRPHVFARAAMRRVEQRLQGFELGIGLVHEPILPDRTYVRYGRGPGAE